MASSHPLQPNSKAKDVSAWVRKGADRVYACHCRPYTTLVTPGSNSTLSKASCGHGARGKLETWPLGRATNTLIHRTREFTLTQGHPVSSRPPKSWSRLPTPHLSSSQGPHCQEERQPQNAMPPEHPTASVQGHPGPRHGLHQGLKITAIQSQPERRHSAEHSPIPGTWSLTSRALL